MLSVVIPIRNAADDVRDQLAALADQSFEQPWEVVVADNGSTDGIGAVIASFVDRLPGLRRVDASHRAGQAHAVNIGARASTGDALLFLDADDVVAPGYLHAMSRALTEHPFVAARLDCDALNPPWVRNSRPRMQTDAVGTPFGFLPSGAGCSLGVRRELFESVGGFDEDIILGNDVDFCWRVQLASGPLVFVPEAVVQYRYRASMRGIFDQARSYGTAGPVLYRRYRHRGMPRRPWRKALRFHGALLVRLLRIRSRSDVAEWVFLAGYRVGLVEACIGERVLYV